MQTFNFPYHTFETEYPESGTRVQFGGSYIFTSPPNGPDLRRFTLNFETMFYYPNEPIVGPYLGTDLTKMSSSGASPSALALSSSLLSYDPTIGTSSWTTSSGTTRSLYARNPNEPLGYTSTFPVNDQTIYRLETQVEIVAVAGTDVPRMRFNTVQLKDDPTVSAGSNSGSPYISMPTPGVYNMSVTYAGPLTTSDISWSSLAARVRMLLEISQTTTAGTTFKIQKFTVYKYSPAAKANWQISRDINPTYNMAVLEDFYNYHKMNKTFYYPHPIYGTVQTKFYSPLKIPKGNKGGGGTLGDFSLELIEIV